MRRTRAAILTVLVLAVAGCGGDPAPSGPGTTARQAQMTDETGVDAAESSEATAAPHDGTAGEDALAEERRQVEAALLEAARGQADAEAAGREARLGAAADFAPYVSTGGHAEFDGRDVRVYLPIHADGYPVVLSSVTDGVDGTAAAPRVAGYSQRAWTLHGDGALAAVSVRWNDRDDGDYLAAGWWMRGAFGHDGMEAGAFIDGAELRGPLPDSLSLPLSGRAVYHGEAAGLYRTHTRVHCTAFPCDIPDTDEVVGEFVADAKLAADFERGDIEGCVGCREGIRFTPVAFDAAGGDVERGSAAARDYLFWLHRARFIGSPYSKGAFSGDLSVVPLGGHAAGHGYWQGRFSNLADGADNPRLLGGTLHGQFEDETTATWFTGVLSAESAAFGGSP